MKPLRKKFRVTEGNSHASIYPYRDAWRFGWRESPEAKWQYTTVRGTKEQATEAAREKLREIHAGGIIWSSLSPSRRHFLEAVHREASADDQDAVLTFLAGRKKSGRLPDAVARFMAFKTVSKKGKQTAHLEQVGRDLAHLAAAFPESLVIDLTLDQLAAWWQERTGSAGDARRRSIRTSLVTFWMWARKDGIAGNDQDTLAQRLPTIAAEEGSLEIFSIPELEYLLSVIERKWFPLVILGAFQGIRPEEIAPKKKNTKQRLRWEDLDWEFDSIRISKHVAKGGKRPRTIPLHPVTRAWLEAYGAGPTWTGPIAADNPSEVHPRATTAWGDALAARFPDRFTGWPKDALRHSYASYRNAVLRNLAQVAEEMGNSIGQLHWHYHNPRTTKQGQEFFDFFPQDAKILAPYLRAA